MKTKYLIHLLFLAFISFAVVSCSDDNEDTPPGPDVTPDELPTEYNDTYTNFILNENSTGVLSLTYSGSVLYGKSVQFELVDEESATLTLAGILPMEPSVVLNVNVAETADGYSFKGETASPKGTTFSYGGSVKEGELTLDLTDIKIPSNPLSQVVSFPTSSLIDTTPVVSSTLDTSDDSHWISNTLVEYTRTTNCLLDWKVLLPGQEMEQHLLILDNADFSIMAESIISALLFYVIEEFQFQPDGNVRAKYASLPENFDLMSVLMSATTGGLDASLRNEVITSPDNLCFYFVDGENVYIQLNVDMIMWAIQTNQSRADGFDLSSILELLPTVSRWLEEGIKFRLDEKDMTIPDETVEKTSRESGDRIIITITTTRYYNTCKYELYLEQDELQPILVLLPAVVQSLLQGVDLTVDTGILGVLDLSPLIDQILESVPYTSTCNLGLRLY